MSRISCVEIVFQDLWFSSVFLFCVIFFFAEMFLPTISLLNHVMITGLRVCGCKI